jgi:hypothetical protein
MAEKIYLVTQRRGGEASDIEFLVKANNQPQALRAIVKHTHSVSLASQADLVRLIGDGVTVLDGTALTNDDKDDADGE